MNRNTSVIMPFATAWMNWKHRAVSLSLPLHSGNSYPSGKRYGETGRTVLAGMAGHRKSDRGSKRISCLKQSRNFMFRRRKPARCLLMQAWRFFIPPVLFPFLLVYNMELTIFFILSNDVLPDSLYRIPSTTKIIISQLKFL